MKLDSVKKIGVVADHAGYQMKEDIKRFLQKWAPDVEIEDFGTFSDESVDYPDFAHKLGEAVSSGRIRWGISSCGSANGISMVLNKYPDVRAAISWNTEIARLARQHNNANIISIPGRFVSTELGEEMVETFFSTEFEGGRHERRVEKINRH